MRRAGIPLPAHLANAPELLPGLDFYYEAFQRLTTSRLMGYASCGPIPYAAISGYCKDEGIEGEMREDLFYHVERLDAAYISFQTDKSRREREAQEAAARQEQFKAQRRKR